MYMILRRFVLGILRSVRMGMVYTGLGFLLARLELQKHEPSVVRRVGREKIGESKIQY